MIALLLVLAAEPPTPPPPPTLDPPAERMRVPAEKADLLVVVAHPDDESTFGGLIPYYACRGRRVAFISLTSGEWGNGLPHHTDPDGPAVYSYDGSDVERFPAIPADATYPSYFRETELAAMLREVGVDAPPTTPRFRDYNRVGEWGSANAGLDFWGREEVVGYLTEQIDRCRPSVVVTMAADGYNGNPQHMAASRATVLAVEAAADAGGWDAPKLYLAVTQGADKDQRAGPRPAVVHAHDWEIACPGGGPTARELADRGNVKHASQGMKADTAKATDFVLVRTRVGPDDIGRNDLFEHVPD